MSELREALESAVTQVEKETPVVVPEPVKAEAAPPPPAPPPPPGDAKSAAPTDAPPADRQESAAAPPPPEAKPSPVDKAPKAWKAPVAEKWGVLDPEVKAEIHRREKEITKAFGENSQVREFHRQFQEVIRPYEAHLMTYGKPLEAIGNLLQVEHTLASGPPVMKAQLMAKLIRDYGIDIRALDSALAGEQPDSTQTALEQLLEQKLSPIQDYMRQQQELERFKEQKVRTDAASEVEKMTEDPDTYPHFEEVRDDMADLIELNARRGKYITPMQAYQMAVGLNPAWAAEGAQQAAAQQQQLLASNSRAERALQASASVKSLPSSTPMHVNNAETLRGAIESAFEQVSGR